MSEISDRLGQQLTEEIFINYYLVNTLNKTRSGQNYKITLTAAVYTGSGSAQKERKKISHNPLAKWKISTVAHKQR